MLFWGQQKIVREVYAIGKHPVANIQLSRRIPTIGMWYMLSGEYPPVYLQRQNMDSNVDRFTIYENLKRQICVTFNRKIIYKTRTIQV